MPYKYATWGNQVHNLLANQSLSDSLWAALDATPINVTVADATKPDFPLIYVNKSFEKATGYKTEQVLGTNCRFLQGAETSQQAILAIKAALSERRRIEVELINYRASGEPFWNLLNLTPVFGEDGTLETFIGIQTDITDKKRQASAERNQSIRVQSLGILAGGLAHEINNLLQPMMTYPPFIREALPSNAHDALEGLSLIETHTQASKSIVAQILAYARSEASEMVPLCLAKSTRKLVADMVPRLPQTIELSFSLEDQASEDDYLVLADAPGIRSLVCNMIKNAADAIGEQPGRIAIRMLRHGPDIRLNFADTGCGISPSDLPHLFDPFFTTKPVGKGTGLGLALVEADVRRWGGSIVASSTRSTGTRFDVTLPAWSARKQRESQTSLASRYERMEN